MNSDINKASKSIVEQEPQDQNPDPEIKPEVTAKRVPAANPEASDVLLEYSANGFRVPTE